MKNNPFIVFLRNQWSLLLILLVTNWACMTEMHFKVLGKWRHDEMLGGIWAPATPMDFCGPLLWLPPFGIGVVLIVLFIMHTLFRDTINADINGNKVVEYWEKASIELKLILIFGSIVGLILSLSILYAPLARVGA